MRDRVRVGRMMRWRRAAPEPWKPTGWNPWAALHTICDYEECARGASPEVRHVHVRGAANDPKMREGVVEVRVQGAWRRRLPREVVEKVRAEIVARKPINITLSVISW